jgi:hypothetical protein
MTFSSCKKSNNSTSLIGTWRICIEDVDEGKWFFDITFNTDGKGSLEGWAAIAPDIEYEKEYHVPFYYNFNQEENNVTFIDVNNHNDIEVMQEIWYLYYLDLYKNNSKELAFTYGVQVKGKIMELTDSNNLTVPFTRQ